MFERYLKKYSSYEGEIAPSTLNIISENFKAEMPEEKCVSNITEASISSGKVYLSLMIDRFDGAVVGNSAQVPMLS